MRVTDRSRGSSSKQSSKLENTPGNRSASMFLQTNPNQPCQGSFKTALALLSHPSISYSCCRRSGKLMVCLCFQSLSSVTRLICQDKQSIFSVQGAETVWRETLPACHWGDHLQQKRGQTAQERDLSCLPYQLLSTGAAGQRRRLLRRRLVKKEDTVKWEGREGEKNQYENQQKTREAHTGEREVGKTENRKSNLRLHGEERFTPSAWKHKGRCRGEGGRRGLQQTHHNKHTANFFFSQTF